jgi:hypothetical protein
MSEPYGILTMSQFEEIYKVVTSKDAEIARLRLTDEERAAILTAADLLIGSKPGAALRNLLARLAVK